MAAARELLNHEDSPYAKTLATELDSGRIRALPMCKMTHVEFDELRKDSDLTALGATPEEQYASLRRADAPAMKSVDAQNDQRVTCVEEVAAAEAEVLVRHASMSDEERAKVHANVLELYELEKIRPGTCTYR